MRTTTGWSLNDPTAANAVNAEWPLSLIDALLWSGWRHHGVGFMNSIPLQICGIRRNENHHGLEPERSDRGERGHRRVAAVAD
jgi:hypothetical protein